jgi:hypothetical protein
MWVSFSSQSRLVSLPRTGSPDSIPRRPGRPKLLEDARLTAAIAATRANLMKSRAPGDTEVTQAEVDTAALALVKAGAHPHPRLVLRITGGSLVTISQKFANWLQRLALKEVDPNERSLELPMKVGLRLQLLVAHLADAVREEVREIPNPTDALLAAARLGEHQAMKAQIAALEARCQKLSEALEATTFRLAKTEVEARDRAVLATQLDAAVQRLADSLAQSVSAGRAAHPTLKRTLAQVDALREGVRRRQARKKPTEPPPPKAHGRSPPSARRQKVSRNRRTKLRHRASGSKR